MRVCVYLHFFYIRALFAMLCCCRYCVNMFSSSIAENRYFSSSPSNSVEGDENDGAAIVNVKVMENLLLRIGGDW